MSVQPPGRRTESLFDNRYRYDYIYPRGRSGETLRAYDTLDGDRPVVIKRPAPQDAPPMRAGQEVSIRNEKQALERLSGHPVLAELRGSGTFRVGGQSHDYIVMDLAHGQIVENMVLELAQQGQHLPELETLVIIDNLLDLLAYAHEKLVIYNDVDAKHLFWDRDAYHLTLIDWGNAVFPDEPGALPSVTRASDIYQVGELLYFVLTGGNRLSVAVDDGDAFFVNFGADAEHVPAKLQTILTRAVHPDLKRRYVTMAVDWRAFGERRDGRDPYPGRDPCNVHFIRGSLLGLNMLTLNIWDGMKAIDYLQSRPEVDGNRIGCMGLSGGGTMTTWISLLDERVKAADIICYSDTFPRFAVARANFCGNQFLPGLYRLCDVGDLHGMIAPRPLLLEIGLYDSCFLYEDAIVARDKARRIYQAAGAADKLEVDEFPGEHGFGGRRTFAFFDRFLRAAG